ncbi:hypothetical protein EsDP_00001776 [Epichloe bromicola]|uniref:Uncharacterized protein n=1 Tax=Epichloe bromicola TaxID=79588 RepID=A0ABQ0CIV1_9HYPO
MGDANSSFITTLTHVVKTIWSLPWARYTALLISSIALPLRTLWIPFSYLAGGLQALFAPAAHVLSYAGGWVAGAAGFLVSLEFSIAALIGVIAGVLTANASAILTTSFNMQDHDQHASRKAYQKNSALESQYIKEQYLKDQYLSAGEITHLGLEPDWRWADAASSPSPNSARFRHISSVQAQTIHEEEDDSEQ